jgi:hypothetical protein
MDRHTLVASVLTPDQQSLAYVANAEPWQALKSYQCLLAKESTLQGKTHTKKWINTGLRTKKNYITEKESLVRGWELLAVDPPWLDAPSSAVHKIPSAVTSSSRLRPPLAPSVASAMCRSSDYGQNPDPDLKKHVRRRNDGAACARVVAWRRRARRCVCQAARAEEQWRRRREKKGGRKRSRERERALGLG